MPDTQARVGCKGRVLLERGVMRPFVTHQLIKPVKTNMKRSLAFPWPVVHMALARDGFISSAAESSELRRCPHRMPKIATQV